jgi:hypothetical protein
MGNDKSSLYYLISDVSEELAHFINTGKQPEKDRGTNKEYHVFLSEQEEGMIKRWTELGMTVLYNRQQIKLVSQITITYMKVQNPKTGLSISIIPWFVVAGRPYPIFTYVYAIGHYQRAGKKSLEESAAAVRKLFGISNFHKSTVSRSLSAMEEFIDTSRLGQPLLAEAFKKPCCLPDSQVELPKADGDVIEQVSKILTAYPSFESLEREFGEKVRRLPQPIKRADKISHALSDIPDEPFEIIIRSKPGGRPSRDHRKRPPQPRNKGPGFVQRPLKFVDYPQREEKRKAIIKICRYLALDAAITHHRFLV